MGRALSPMFEWRSTEVDQSTTSRSRASPRRILIVDDEPHLRAALAAQLTGYGYKSDTAEGVGRAFQLLERYRYWGVAIDGCLGDGHGMDVYERVRALYPQSAPVLMSSFPASVVAEADRRGYGYFPLVGRKGADYAARIHEALSSESRKLPCVEERVAAGQNQRALGEAPLGAAGFTSRSFVEWTISTTLSAVESECERARMTRSSRRRVLEDTCVVARVSVVCAIRGIAPAYRMSDRRLRAARKLIRSTFQVASTLDIASILAQAVDRTGAPPFWCSRSLGRWLAARVAHAEMHPIDRAVLEMRMAGHASARCALTVGVSRATATRIFRRVLDEVGLLDVRDDRLASSRLLGHAIQSLG